MKNNDKVPIPYLESIRTKGTKTIKPKIWLERFEQYTECIYEIDTEPNLIESKTKELVLQKVNWLVSKLQQQQ